MPALSYCSNVHNTALNLIANRGFRIWRQAEPEVICAEKDGWDFMADDPVQLLGIITIYETLEPAEYSDYWWWIREPWLNDDLPDSPPEYTPIWKKG